MIQAVLDRIITADAFDSRAASREDLRVAFGLCELGDGEYQSNQRDLGGEQPKRQPV